LDPTICVRITAPQPLNFEYINRMEIIIIIIIIIMIKNIITEKDIDNYKRVHPFIYYRYCKKITGEEDEYKDKIKNMAIETLFNNRDLIDETLKHKIDINKLSSLDINSITDDDVDIIYDYLLSKYHNDDIIEEYVTKEANYILYKYIKEFKDIDYVHLYLSIRNRELDKKFNYYPEGYAAKIIDLLHRFIEDYSSMLDWKKFYITITPILDILHILGSECSDGELLRSLYSEYNELLTNNFMSEAQYQEEPQTPSFDTDFLNMCKEPLAKERKSDDKNKFMNYYGLDRNTDIFNQKLISVLDDYYISKLYYYINKQNIGGSFVVNDEFMKIILNKYPNFIPDMNKVIEMIDNENTVKSFKLYLQKEIQFDSIWYKLDIIKDFNLNFYDYIRSYYSDKASLANLSYRDVKEYLL